MHANMNYPLIDQKGLYFYLILSLLVTVTKGPFQVHKLWGADGREELLK